MMRTFMVTAFIASILASCSATLNLVKKDNPSVLHLDIIRKTAFTVEEPLSYDEAVSNVADLS